MLTPQITATDSSPTSASKLFSVWLVRDVESPMPPRMIVFGRFQIHAWRSNNSCREFMQFHLKAVLQRERQFSKCSGLGGRYVFAQKPDQSGGPRCQEDHQQAHDIGHRQVASSNHIDRAIVTQQIQKVDGRKLLDKWLYKVQHTGTEDHRYHDSNRRCHDD